MFCFNNESRNTPAYKFSNSTAPTHVLDFSKIQQSAAELLMTEQSCPAILL